MSSGVGGWKRKLWPLLPALLLGALYLAAANPEFRFMEGASAIKLLQARSLLEGRGYTDIGRLGAPPEIARPPGFAVVVAAIMSVFGEDMLALKIINNFFAALAAVALFFLLRGRTDDPGLSAALVLAGFLFPSQFVIARYLEAEFLFAFLFFGALAMFEAAQDRGFKDRALLAGFALAMTLACLVRTVGLCLVPAAVLVLLVSASATRQTRMLWAGVILTSWLAVGGGWMLRNQLAAPKGELTYLNPFMVGEPVSSVYWLLEDQRVPLLPPPSPGGLKELLGRVPPNAGFFLRQVAENLWPASRAWSWVGVITLTALPLALTFLGFGFGLVLKRRLADFTVLCYLPLILLWPYQDNRFLLPVVPLLMLYLVEGTKIMAGRLLRDPGKARRPARFIALAALFLVSAIFARQDLQRLLEFKQPSAWPVLERHPHFRITSPHLGAYHSLLLLEWLRTHTVPGDRILYHAYAPCGLLTRRECTAFPLLGPSAIMKFIDDSGITYVLVDDEAQYGPAYTSALTPKYLVPLIQTYPQRFSAAASAGENARVFRVIPR